MLSGKLRTNLPEVNDRRLEGKNVSKKNIKYKEIHSLGTSTFGISQKRILVKLHTMLKTSDGK